MCSLQNAISPDRNPIPIRFVCSHRGTERLSGIQAQQQAGILLVE